MFLRRFGPKTDSGKRLMRAFAGLAGFMAIGLAACAGPGSHEAGPTFGEHLQALGRQEQPALGTTGGIRVGLILSLSAAGNAGIAATSMRNAAELALAEFAEPNIHLVVKDDGGTAQGAQVATHELLTEGAEIILGPMFSHAVAAAGQSTRNRGVPMIAFSTDTNVAARGVYLLSFLPETNVERIVSHSVANGKRSFLALLPDNAYGTVIEGHFKQVVAARGGRVAALEHYGEDQDRMIEPVRKVATAVRQADTVFLADSADTTRQLVQLLSANGVSPRRLQFVGTDLWEDPGVYADANLDGAWFAAPDLSGFRGLADRYRARYGEDPVRTASLAYDAVSLVAALVKTQGANRFSEEILTNPSGFQGVDGIFRFRADGTSERGLAVLQIRNGTTRVLSPAPRSFSNLALSN
jgi:ABC-type branched-subunit amino acid transport system substrate-binding protein